MATEKSCLGGNQPIEIVSGVPKDAQGLRAALMDMLSQKMGGGVEAYPGPVAVGLDPLQSMGSNILSQQMYGQDYSGPNVSGAPWLGSGLPGMNPPPGGGGGGTGGGGGDGDGSNGGRYDMRIPSLEGAYRLEGYDPAGPNSSLYGWPFIFDRYGYNPIPRANSLYGYNRLDANSRNPDLPPVMPGWPVA